MNINKGLLLSACVIALGGCTSPAERQIASGDFEYMNANTGNMLKVPDDLDSPSFSRQYELPELGEAAPKNLLGQSVKITSPRLVLPLVRGTFIEEGTKTATIKFEQVSDREQLSQTIWNTVVGFLEKNDIGINEFQRENGLLKTDWILELEEDGSWYSFESTERRTGRRYEFVLNMAPHGRSGELNVQLKDYLKTVNNEVVEGINDIQLREQEVNMLNEMIAYYDYTIGLENSRRIAQIRKGLATEMGFNADGEPAFLVDGIYDVTWPRLQLVLRNMGFDVKDLDKTTGLLFVSYNSDGGSWWSDLFSSNEELLEPGDYRLMVNEQGQKTSVTFMSEESVPFEVKKITDLYKPFSEVMSKDDLDI